MKHALLETLPGRAIVVGLVIKLCVLVLGFVLVPQPAFVGVVDTVASIVVAAGGAYFLIGGIASAKRHLLWRVRRKLIISYIFVGFVPAILIIAFFLLGGLLLFSNFSAYLLQSRLRSIAERAQSLAESIALEIQRGGDLATILSQRQRLAEMESPGASIAVVPVSRRCSARGVPGGAAVVATQEVSGAWAHVDPPQALPGWVPCDGFGGLLAYRVSPTEVHVLPRGAAFPDSDAPSYAVVVDLPVNDDARERLRQETGVWLSDVSLVRETFSGIDLGGDVGVLPPPSARPGAGGAASATPGKTCCIRFNALPLNSVSFLEVRDWNTGASGQIVASMQLNVSDVYNRISAAEGSAGQSFRQGLLVALLVIGILLLFIQFVALVAGLVLARSITGSVHELFVGTERVRQSDFTHKIAVKTDDQLGELAKSFNSMTESIEALMVQEAEKKRLEEELRIAHDIQMSLLPQSPPSIPGLSVARLCVPAREVGGDYYDFFQLGDQRLGVLIADVSGKGTSAALYMAELKGLVLSLSRIYTSPRALLIAANRLIAEHLDSRSFITITYAIVDLAARTMTYARAGHTPLIYVSSAAEHSNAQILAPDGLVLGLKIDDGTLFERLLQEETITLGKGDLLLFFTDGITEAMNDQDDLFGEQRLAQLVQEHAHLPSDELGERLRRAVSEFVGSAPQHDDMTMILLKIDAVDVTAADAGRRIEEMAEL